MRSAFRSLRRWPAFAAGVIATLALGISAVVLIFAVLNAVVLRPLPYRDPDRLVMLWTDDVQRGIHEEGVGLPTVMDWKRMATLFDDFAVCGRGHTAVLTDQSEPERVDGGIVSANLFAVLGVAPALGRSFTAEEDERGARVAVISHGMWQRRFGLRTDAIGKSIELDGRPYEVIGVMPASFEFPSKVAQFWIPMPDHGIWPEMRRLREADFFKVVGRMKPGVTAEAAQREMSAIGQRLAKLYPSSNPEFAGYGVSVVGFQRQLLGSTLPLALWLLLGACGLVLLVACGNAAGLMLARNGARAREFAVRVALGAQPRGLLRQQLSESILLAMVASGAGVAFAAAMLRVLIHIAGAAVPRLTEAAVDVRVASFAVASAIFCAVLTGPVAAWRVVRANPRDALANAGRAVAPGARAQSWLVAGQAALSVVLLAGAGLLVRSLLELRHVQPGFDTGNTLMLQIDRGTNSRKDAPTFWREVLARLNAMPGVRAGAIGDFFFERNPDYVVTVEGGETVSTEQITGDNVTPGFFEAAGVRLLAGRMFTESDYPGEMRVAILNQTMARRLWPGVDPVGRRMKYGPAQSRARWMTVVGVVEDMRRGSLEAQPIAQGFGPGYGSEMDLIVRSERPAAQLAPEVRAIIRSVDASTPVFGITTLADRLKETTLTRRLETWLLAGFAALTLLLAAIGVYATMRQAVNDRRREFGIRFALGARPAEVSLMVVRRALLVAGAGSAVGVLLALWLGKLVGALLYQVKPSDPWAISLACAAVLTGAVAACAVPAWRAGRVDPARVLAE